MLIPARDHHFFCLNRNKYLLIPKSVRCTNTPKWRQKFHNIWFHLHVHVCRLPTEVLWFENWGWKFCLPQSITYWHDTFSFTILILPTRASIYCFLSQSGNKLWKYSIIDLYILFLVVHDLIITVWKPETNLLISLKSIQKKLSQLYNEGKQGTNEPGKSVHNSVIHVCACIHFLINVRVTFKWHNQSQPSQSSVELMVLFD